MSEQALALPTTPADVAALYYARLKPSSRRAYTRALADFAAHVGAAGALEAAERFLALPGPQANALAYSYQTAMLQKRLSSSTVNVRMAALASLAKAGRLAGMVDWSVEVPSVRREPRHDRRGPTRSEMARVLAAAREMGTRTHAMIRLLYGLGLRRGELAGLRACDVERSREPWELVISAKGRREMIRLPLPPNAQAALRAWLEESGVTGEELVFVSGGRIAEVIAKVGEKAGLAGRLRPHGLRRSAVTAALERTNGNIREVASFARHADPRTTARVYDDEVMSVGKRVAALLDSE